MTNLIDLLKYKWMRRRFEFSAQTNTNLRFKIAETVEEYKIAGSILYESYLKKGYTPTLSEKLKITPHQLIPTTTVILAYLEDQIIGTVSLVRDNSMGLPMESIFDLSSLRKGNKILCEVSALAIKEEYRGRSGEIFFPMVRYLWHYARYNFGVDYCVIAVNPKMKSFYEAFFYYKQLSEQKSHSVSYASANNNPAVCLYLDVKGTYDSILKQKLDRDYPQKLVRYMERELPYTLVAQRKLYFTHLDSKAEPSWIRRLESFVPELRKQTDLYDKLSRGFGYNSYTDLLNRGDVCRYRIPTSFTLVDQKETKITNASLSGIKLTNFPKCFLLSKQIIITCQISNIATAKLLIRPIWSSDSATMGCKILSCCPNWQRLFKDHQSAQNESAQIILNNLKA